MPLRPYTHDPSKIKRKAWARRLGARACSFVGVIGLSVALFGGSELAAQPSKQGEAKLQLDISVNQQALSESRVQIDSTLTNGLSHSISFPIWNTPFSNQITGRIFKVERRANTFKFGSGKVGGGHTVVPYTGIMLKRGPSSAQEYLILEPGQQIRNSLDITDVYDFTDNSQIRVSYDRPVNIGNNTFQSLASNAVDFLF